MYKRILVPVDGSRTAAAGLREAVRLAFGNNQAKICLLHVMDPLPAMQGMEMLVTEQVLENMEGFGKKILKDAKSLVQRHGIGVDAVFHRQATGRTSDAIVRQARKWRADVIVMGTHGRRGVSRIVMGSDAEAVVRSAPAPVLLVRSGDRR
jgi:nucleotide-binding universal stress UspA family protein